VGKDLLHYARDRIFVLLREAKRSRSKEREKGNSAFHGNAPVVEAWVSELCRRFGHGPIAVAVEQVKGALVYMLRKYECLHLYPVPSTMSASMRKAL
jgi:hypothetical protein